MIANVGVAKHGVEGAADGATLAHPLRWGQAKNVAATDDIDGGNDRIEWS
jgi:hypothetical protein